MTRYNRRLTAATASGSKGAGRSTSKKKSSYEQASATASRPATATFSSTTVISRHEVDIRIAWFDTGLDPLPASPF